MALAGIALLLVVLGATSGAGGPRANPRTGSTFVEAMVGAPRFVNPLLAASDTDRDLTHLVYSGLTRVDEHGDLVGDLASSWQVSPDARVFTFTLKPDLHWHDGEPLTADDVLFTLGLLRAPDFPGDPALAQSWRDVKPGSPSQQVVTFELTSPNVSFVQHTTLGILPRHLWSAVAKAADLPRSELNNAPIGSGPWRYVRAANQSGSSSNKAEGQDKPQSGTNPTAEGVLLEPYPAHPSAQIGRLWFRLYPSFGAALTGFKAGEVHGLGHIPADETSGVEATGAEVLKAPLARYAMLLLNTRSPLFDKVETRQAIEYAIDRQAIVKQVLQGRGRAAMSPVLEGSWAYDGSLPYRGYDPARARGLLDAAGWKTGAGGVRAREGLTLTVVLSANADVPLNVAVARQIEDYLRAVGVDVKPAYVSRDVLLRDYLTPRAFHLVVANWEAEGVDPDLYRYWHSSQMAPGLGLNFAGWGNAQADAALDAARRTSSRDERKKFYSDFQKMFLADVPAVVLFNPLYEYAVGGPVRGALLPGAEMLDPAQRFDMVDSWSLQPVEGR
ncbi:MAG TPA: peptide ABC transporter substrate-binding protein [Chloroflexia bacterium]|nr:peptide ABC transporter substrate-binding protein [Chloroflexia bacterium]